MYLYDENDLFSIADKTGYDEINSLLAQIKPYEIDDKIVKSSLEETEDSIVIWVN